MSRWSLESWKNYILDQAPGWQDNQELKNTTNQIRIEGNDANTLIDNALDKLGEL